MSLVTFNQHGDPEMPAWFVVLVTAATVAIFTCLAFSEKRNDDRYPVESTPVSITESDLRAEP